MTHDVLFRIEKVEDFEAEFERIYGDSKQHDKLFGLDKEDQIGINIDEYMKRVDIDQIFPESLVKDLFRYEDLAMQFKSVSRRHNLVLTDLDRGD